MNGGLVNLPRLFDVENGRHVLEFEVDAVSSLVDVEGRHFRSSRLRKEEDETSH